MSQRILIVDDEESIRYTFQAFLEDAGYGVDTASSRDDAFERIARQPYDAVFLDILLGRDNGMDVLRECREKRPNCPVVMVTGAPDIATASEAVRLGAFDYITKPVHQEDLLRKAALAVRHKEMVDQQEQARLRMEAVFRSIREGILIFDDAVRLVEINKAAREMLGCTPDIIGKSLSELMKHPDCDVFASFGELIQHRCEGELFAFETVNSRQEKLQLSLSIAPLTSASAREIGVVMVIRDESSRS